MAGVHMLPLSSNTPNELGHYQGPMWPVMGKLGPLTLCSICGWIHDPMSPCYKVLSRSH